MNSESSIHAKVGERIVCCVEKKEIFRCNFGFNLSVCFFGLAPTIADKPAYPFSAMLKRTNHMWFEDASRVQERKDIVLCTYYSLLSGEPEEGNCYILKWNKKRELAWKRYVAGFIFDLYSVL